MVTQLVPIVVLIFAVIAIMLVAQQAKKTYFKCPVCRCAFKVPVSMFLTTYHMLGKRNVTCPNCGYRGMLSPIDDDKGL